MASRSQVHSIRDISGKGSFHTVPSKVVKRTSEKVTIRSSGSIIKTPTKVKPLPSKAGSKTPAKAESLLERFGTSVIHIKVGKEPKDFGIHKSLICHHSPFFRKAFNSDFEEGRTGVMKLEETGLEVFGLFFVWLYSQNAWFEETLNPEPSQETLIDLYLFADMVQIPALKNTVLHRLCDLLRGAAHQDQVKSVGMFNYIWDNTTPSSPIRWLMIDLCAWEYRCNFIFSPENANLVRSEIYAEIVSALGTRTYESLKVSPLITYNKYIEAETLQYNE